MLPFEPEPLEKLKARFPDALKKVWHVTALMEDRPGLHREQVFDFDSGLRLLVSVDKLTDDPEPELHLSASWQDSTRLRSFVEADSEVRTAYYQLGGKGEVLFIGISPDKKIPHWWVMDYEHKRVN